MEYEKEERIEPLVSVGERERILKQLEAKTFRGKIQCSDCKKFFNPYRIKMRLAPIANMELLETRGVGGFWLCQKCYNEWEGYPLVAITAEEGEKIKKQVRDYIR